jgi:hypothetical protein
LEPCSVCKGPWIVVKADGHELLSCCLTRLRPGDDWFSMVSDRRLSGFHLLPSDHEILQEMENRHRAWSDAIERAEAEDAER